MNAIISENDARALVADMASILSRAETILNSGAVQERFGARSGQRMPGIGDNPGPSIDDSIAALPFSREELEGVISDMREAAEKASRTQQVVEKLTILFRAAVPVLGTLAKVAGIAV